jgi:hypothetical protein
MTDRWITVTRTTSADGYALAPRKRMGSELHSELFLVKMHRSINCILCKDRIDKEAEEKSWEGRKAGSFNTP